MPAYTLIKTGDIADAQLTTAKIADLNVTTGKLANLAATTAKIADLNVTTGKLAASAVTTAKILDANVTTAKMADDSVTSAKLADVSGLGMSQAANGTLDVNVDGSTINLNGTDQLQVPADGITASQIAANAVGSSELADDAVDTAAIQDDAVTNAKVAADAIQRAQIADNAVGADELDLAANYTYESTSAVTFAASGSASWATTPTAATHLVNKAYVDAQANGLSWKDSVRAASTANVTISGPGAAIDGVSLSQGDRVLLKNQTDATENGIYVWDSAATAMVRSTDMDAGSEFPGAAVFVREGSAANADIGFVCSTDSVTLGSTDIVFVEFTGAYNVEAGAGLSKSGNVLSVNAGDGLIISGDDVAIQVAGSGGLELNADSIQVKPNNGVQTDSNGLTLRLAGGNSTIEYDSGETAGQQGIKVKFDAAAGLMSSNSTGLQARINTDSLEFDGGTGAIDVKDLGIGTAELAGLAVTTAKIADAAVTLAKLGADVVNAMSGYTNTAAGQIASDGDTITIPSNCPTTVPGHLFFLNGRLMELGASRDYTISGTTLTIVGGSVAGDRYQIVFDSNT